jgi:hypothetical protein
MISWLKWALFGQCDHYRMKDVLMEGTDHLVVACKRCGDSDILWTNGEHAGCYSPLGRPA